MLADDRVLCILVPSSFIGFVIIEAMRLFKTSFGPKSSSSIFDDGIKICVKLWTNSWSSSEYFVIDFTDLADARDVSDDFTSSCGTTLFAGADLSFPNQCILPDLADTRDVSDDFKSSCETPLFAGADLSLLNQCLLEDLLDFVSLLEETDPLLFLTFGGCFDLMPNTPSGTGISFPLSSLRSTASSSSSSKFTWLPVLLLVKFKERLLKFDELFWGILFILSISVKLTFFRNTTFLGFLDTAIKRFSKSFIWLMFFIIENFFLPSVGAFCSFKIPSLLLILLSIESYTLEPASSFSFCLFITSFSDKLLFVLSSS